MKTRSGFERPFLRLAASGSIDDKTNIACFAVLARRKYVALSGRRRSFQIEPKGTTLLELVLAIAILGVVFTAVVPLFTHIRQSSEVQAASTDAIQNGRVLMAHLQRQLSCAVSINAVSSADTTLGYIEFVDNDANTMRYEVSSGNVYYGPVGNLSLLAGPVSQLQFTCYAESDLTTPITDVNSIRYITIQATLTNASGSDKTFQTSVFLQVEASTATQNLMGWWPLDDGSGSSTATDASGHGNDGTLKHMNKSSAWVTGQIQGALTFDGYNDYVDCGHDSSLDLTDDLTIAFWTRVGSFSNQPDVVTKGTYNQAYSVWFDNNGKIVFDLNNDSLTSTSSLSTGTWYHIAVTWESGTNTRKIYINGQEDKSDTYSGTIGTTSNSLTFSSSSYPLKGTLDDVRLYDCALSQSEIQNLMDRVVYVDFSEAKIASDNTSITINTPTTTTHDLLIAAIATDGDTSASLAAPMGVGWNEIDLDNYNGRVTLGVWWKLAAASEPSSHQFTWTGVQQQAYGWIMHFTGNATTNPIEDFSANGQSSLTPLSPSVTTSTDNDLILRLGAFDNGDITVDHPGLSGHTAITMDSSSSASSGLPDPVGYWALDDGGGTTTADSSGNGYDGTIHGGSWVTGKINGALDLNGSSDYVSLPIGSLIGSLTDCTLAAWVNWQGSQDWQRVWDFGSSESVNMFLTTSNGSSHNPRFAITTGGYSNEDRTTASSGLTPGWHHLTVTIEKSVSGWGHGWGHGGGHGWGHGTTITHRLYVDGTLAATNSSANYCPQDLGQTQNNWLGRSQYSVDPYFNGPLDEIRIYNQTLSASEVSALAQWSGNGCVSGGAGYVTQANAGSSGDSTFTLTSANAAQTLTLAIKPR